MRRILTVSFRLGLTGCQLIRLQEASIILNVATLDLMEAVQKVKSVVDLKVLADNDIQTLISKVSEANLLSE